MVSETVFTLPDPMAGEGVAKPSKQVSFPGCLLIPDTTMTTKQKLSIDRTGQIDFFSGVAREKPEASSKREDKTTNRSFLAPNPERILLGQTPLKLHLEQAGQKAPFVISELLDNQDWSAFESKYATSGRPPYSPRCMVGLILYGIFKGVSSLRSLESLSQVDLACMWVSGGIFPDHTNIGRFINRHAEQLTGTFFEALTSSVLKKTGSGGQCLAGDGTKIEAACSNYNLIKEEAAQAALKSAQTALVEAPEDPEKIEALRKQTLICDKLQELKAHQERRGAKTENTRISPTEPEAVVQKMKRGRGYAPAYTPSILANEKRVVLAQAIDPTNESSVIPKMLDQATRTASVKPDELLLDGNYFNNSVIETSLEYDISLLCPESGHPGQPLKSKKFQKGHFRYDGVDDVYICPAEQRLSLLYRPAEPTAEKAQWVYGNAPCTDCPLREKCTTNKKGRRIRRFAEDENKDALRQVMQHPAAKKIFKQRQAMVEPVFGYLRTVQGLNRFRRRGLSSVTVEFSLHLMAYNLSRAVAACFYGIVVYLWTIMDGFQRAKTFDCSQIATS